MKTGEWEKEIGLFDVTKGFAVSRTDDGFTSRSQIESNLKKKNFHHHQKLISQLNKEMLNEFMISNPEGN